MRAAAAMARGIGSDAGAQVPTHDRSLDGMSPGGVRSMNVFRLQDLHFRMDENAPRIRSSGKSGRDAAWLPAENTCAETRFTVTT